jgi:hypothetical protein
MTTATMGPIVAFVIIASISGELNLQFYYHETRSSACNLDSLHNVFGTTSFFSRSYFFSRRIRDTVASISPTKRSRSSSSRPSPALPSPPTPIPSAGENHRPTLHWRKGVLSYPKRLLDTLRAANCSRIASPCSPRFFSGAICCTQQLCTIIRVADEIAQRKRRVQI